ncbi:branched-chain amino acid ABC transporter permease, partial [Halorubrum sp. SP3]
SLGGFTVNMVIFGALSLATFALTGYWLVRVFQRQGRRGRLILGVLVPLIAVWYFVLPTVSGGMVELTRNTLWLFDPTAGPNG